MKLSWRHIKAFEVFNRVGSVAYRLSLFPSLLGVYIVFHVSILNKDHKDGDYIIHWNLELFDKKLYFVEVLVAIFDRDVRKLWTKAIAFVKVQWRNHQT